MSRILNAGPTFEHRAAAWGEAARGLEDKLAAEVSSRLGAMASALSAGEEHPLKSALARTALGLIEDVAARGAEGLATPHAPYDGPIVHTGPERQALYDALLLRSVGEGVCDDIADAIEVRAADEGVRDYRTEIIISALIDVAAADADPTEDFLMVNELVDVQEAVAFSPRSIIERTIITDVRPTDTLQSIARRVYGDGEAWERLIADYDLVPPYLTSAPRTRCLWPGKRLLRPGGSESAVGDDGMGSSFRLTTSPAPGGQEWDLTPSPSGGIEMVYGLDALAVDCAVRLATPLGDLPDDPNYGYPEIPGLNATSSNILAAMLAADTLMQDGRVADVVPRLSPHTSRSEGRLVGNVVVIPKTR